jgi:hypothetical protein
MPGIRAEVAVDEPRGCPVARASLETVGSVGNVRWTDADSGTVEQFEAPSDPSGVEVDRIFDYGDRARYEFDRTDGSPCVCERLESHLGPVTDVVATDGTLRVTVHAADGASLRDALGDLTEAFEDVCLASVVRADAEGSAAGLESVDLSRLTDRQREVLETALDLGYFASPRDANATAVAAALDIDPSTFSEHLAVAQRKLLESALES